MKHTFLSILSIGLLFSAISAGCGDESDTNPTGGGTGTTDIPLDSLGSQTAKYFCGLAYSCCDMTELTQAFDDFGIMPKDEAECAAQLAPLYDKNVLADIKASVMAGRQSYDGKKAAACYEVIKDDCTAIQGDPFEQDPNCQTVFVGLVADGGACSMGDDCAGATSHCAGATDTMMGKCEALPKEGQPCPDFTCEDGLACSFGAMNQTCIKPNTKADGQMCESDIECVSNYCDFGTTSCAPQKAIGAMCSFSNECKDSYCDGMSKVCTAKKADGQACMFFDECLSDDCDLDTNLCAPVQGPVCDGK